MTNPQVDHPGFIVAIKSQLCLRIKVNAKVLDGNLSNMTYKLQPDHSCLLDLSVPVSQGLLKLKIYFLSSDL